MTGMRSLMATSTATSSLTQMQASTATGAAQRVAAGAYGNAAAIDKTATDFTSVFMSQMLAPMWEGVETDEMFGGGKGEEMMRGFMLQEYGKEMAKVDNTGMTSAVKAEMIRMQGGASTVQQGALS